MIDHLNLTAVPPSLIALESAMRLTVILYALGMLLAAAWAPAAAEVKVSDETPGSIAIDVDFEDARAANLVVPNRPPIPYVRVFVAVPDDGGIRFQVRPGSPVESAGGVPAAAPAEKGWSEPAATAGDGWYPAAPYQISREFRFRKTRVVAVDFYPVQYHLQRQESRTWDRYGVTMAFDRELQFRAPDSVDPMLRALVANAKYYPAPPASAGAPDPHFSLSSNWVKLMINTNGLYRISGAQLQGIGVNISAINDPSSFRLFTAGGRSQERDLTVAGGTWEPGNWMDELDIHVDYGSDGTFDPGDYIVFHARGAQDWLDRFEPGSPRDGYVRHHFAVQNYYYLSWDDTGFSGSPARMTEVTAPPNVTDPTYRTFESRQYFEQDRTQDYDFGGDGWLWIEFSPRTGLEARQMPSITIQDLVPTRPQTFRTVATSSFRFGFSNNGHHVQYRMNGQLLTAITWDTQSIERFEDARDVTYSGTFLSEGQNTLALTLPRDLNSEDFTYFAWYAVFYERRLKAIGNALTFSCPDTTAALNMVVENFDAAGSAYLYDVTDPVKPVRLTGFSESSAGGKRSLEFGAAVSGGRYYSAATASGMLAPASMIRYFPRDLRNTAQSPHMVMVANAGFTNAATRLQSYRMNNLPLFANPRVQVVTTEEVFDNFSGGQSDPMAIRNYLKFLYDNFDDGQGNPEITYLLLLGDANIDYRNNASSQPNFVLTNLHLHPIVQEAYATDDWFALMDPEDTPGSAYIDIAVGRLPAASPQEANFLVDRTIAYETQAEFGPWRDRVILVADDEKSPSTNNQADFISQSESIAHGFLKRYLEPFKIYLTEFPAIQGIKPGSRLVFLDAWNRGALVINYVGHGSPVQMADEQVFLASDVGNLFNGLRLPLFIAVSCTIGEFASPLAKSLSEKMLLRDGGGAVATITASEVTFIGPNSTFDFRTFQNLFENDPALSIPVGVGLLRAKFESLNFAAPNRLIEENNQKYNLLGDPALRLRSPQRGVELTASEVDTLTTGKRHTISGRVLDGAGDPDLTFNGSVNMVVREPDDPSGYSRESDGFFIQYRYPGGTLFNGRTGVTNGNFSFSFTVPRSAGTGLHGFVHVYVDNGAVDAVGLTDQPVFVPPAPGDSTVVPTDGPPRVDLGFKNGETIVKPGAELRAVIRDADGINTLETTSEGKLAIVLDGGLPVDVTEFFAYDAGGADTAGTLVFPLPALDRGEHEVFFKVADSFGQIRLDTLTFSTTDPGDYSAKVVLNYPNPFKDETYFLVEVTDNAAIRLDIFTLSGQRIRSLEAASPPGEAWVRWDGRDTVGDDVANGIYLYVARVDFPGVDQKTQILRGSVSKLR